MKKSVILMFIFMMFPIINAFAENLVFGSLTYLAPYQYKEEGQWKGIDIEVADEISKKLGIEIKYDGLPWARIKKYLAEGEIHGVVSMFCMEKYLGIADFTEPVYTSKVSVFARKDTDIKVSGIGDMKGKSAGVIRGYTYAPEFENYTDIKREVCDDDTMLVKILEKGRVDLAVAEDIPFWFISRKLGFQDRFKELYTITENNLCIAISKKALGAESRGLADKINKIIRKMKEDGFIEKTINKYRSGFITKTD